MRLGELLVGRLLGSRDPLAEHLGLLQRQQRLAPHVLGQRRDVAVVDELDPVELLVDVGARSASSRDLARVGERRPVGEADVGVGDVLAAEGQRRDAAAADDREDDLGALAARTRASAARPRG